MSGPDSLITYTALILGENGLEKGDSDPSSSLKKKKKSEPNQGKIADVLNSSPKRVLDT